MIRHVLAAGGCLGLAAWIAAGACLDFDPGPGDGAVDAFRDDGDDVVCNQTLCQNGSTACCPGGARGTWNTSLRRCVCPAGADADADADADACDPSYCTDMCRRAGFVGGECRAGACYCTAYADAGADDAAPDVAGCNPAACDASCRSVGYAGGECTTGDLCVCSDVPLCDTEMGGPCNVVTQCGCAEGERCVMTGSDVETCTVAGSDPIDTDCLDDSDDCAPRLQCLSTDAVHWTCMQYCYADADCPADRTCDLGTPWGDYRVCGPPAGG